MSNNEVISQNGGNSDLSVTKETNRISLEIVPSIDDADDMFVDCYHHSMPHPHKRALSHRYI